MMVSARALGESQDYSWSLLRFCSPPPRSMHVNDCAVVLMSLKGRNVQKRDKLLSRF